MAEESGTKPSAASGSSETSAETWSAITSAWSDRWPILRLARAVRIAAGARMLIPAAAGVGVTILGWWVLAWVFSNSEDPTLQAWLASYRSCPFSDGDATALPTAAGGFFAPPELGKFPLADPLVSAWSNLSAPIRQVFDTQISYVALAFLLLCGLWVIAVWGLFGGALARMAAMELARGERIGWRQAFGHSMSKWKSYCSAPLLPLLGVFLTALPLALFALIGRTDAGMYVLGVVWFVYLIGALLMTIFLVGLMFGWPLMWAAIATESSDSFDALSRAYSYVYQRAIKFLALVLVATLLSILGGWLVYGFSSCVIHLADWAAGWGTGRNLALEVPSGSTKIIEFWRGLVRLIAIGFVYSYLWTAAVAIYLLLRHDVDGTELDDIHVDESGEAFGLPALKTDAAGVQVVDDEAAEPEPPKTEPPKSDAPPPPEAPPHSTGLA
jgi:hypothetical protein